MVLIETLNYQAFLRNYGCSALKNGTAEPARAVGSAASNGDGVASKPRKIDWIEPADGGENRRSTDRNGGRGRGGFT